MYDLNKQVASSSSNAGGKGIFKQGVKSRFLNVKDGVTTHFRILPAHNPAHLQKTEEGTYTVLNPQSWVYFRNPEDGLLTHWARLIFVSSFVGHGAARSGGRRDILSPITYGPDLDHVPVCPVSKVAEYAARTPEWKYLTEDIKDAAGNFMDRKAIQAPSEQLIMNVLMPNAVEEGCVVGLMSKSGYISLLGKQGLANQVNTVSPEILQINPMARFSCGDLTNPTDAPLLSLTKENTGTYGKYIISMTQLPNYEVRRFPCPPEIMAQRIPLASTRSLFPVKPEQEIVDELCQLLNGISPSGVHEHVLIKAAVGDMFHVPDPPTRAYSQGFSQPGVAMPGGPPPFPADQGAVSNVPLGGAPVTYAQPYAAPTAPPAGPTPTAPPAGPTPTAPPAGPTPTAPPAGPTPDVPPGMPQSAMPQAPTPTGFAGPPPAPTIPAAATSAPVPGEAPPEYNRDEFLRQLNDKPSA